MKNSTRLFLLVAILLTALAVSAYGVALAAPGLNLNGLLNNFGVDQVTSTETVVATETPEVEGTETPDAEDAEDAEDVEDVDQQDVCATTLTGINSTNSADCNGGSDHDGGGSGGDDSGSDD